MDNTELAYAAGILDGEGCITVARRGDKKGFQLVVTVANTNLPVINWLQARWGGSVHRLNPDKRTIRPRLAWHWVCASKKGSNFLQDVRPYMIIKGDQADNAIAFQNNQGPGRIKPTAEAVKRALGFAAEAKRLKVI
jgi:hypothetical protein